MRPPLQGTRVQALQIVISGMAQGCIYGLIALGLVLIYETTETVSFAHGELMMLGAFAGFACMTLLGWQLHDGRWKVVSDYIKPN